jgi:acetylornithine deacetylase/succinyl-diaminopimelate desuccinylase-like protein
MTQTSSLKSYFQKNNKQIIDDYLEFLRFQSISTDPAYTPQVLACADWLTQYLTKMGFEVQQWPTSGHPTIFASYLKAGPEKPTFLIYNHYDVQPVDPLEEWETPPFEPTIRNGQVYARGAQDNKGQCFYTIQALKALIELNGTLPINIKLIIEGEEETGSNGLAEILQQRQNQLKADYLAIVDVGIPGPTEPTLTLGLRGLVTLDVHLQGSKTDLHSGCHGGVAYNPIHALVELLSKLRNSSGKITVPGFYDDVLPMDEQERQQLNLEFDVKKYETMFGIKPTGGEKAFSPAERNWLRPTLEINGVSGGYAGAGFKTVIPAKAHAKISCRLAPNQDPKKIGALVANFLKENAPEGIVVDAQVRPGGGFATRAKASSIVAQAFAKAYSEVFGKTCEYIFEGASIPIVPELSAASGSEVVMLGLGLADDQIHAPNEHFGLDRIEKGFLIMALAIEKLGN